MFNGQNYALPKLQDIKSYERGGKNLYEVSEKCKNIERLVF
jgi:hypothetical protein